VMRKAAYQKNLKSPRQQSELSCVIFREGIDFECSSYFSVVKRLPPFLFVSCLGVLLVSCGGVSFSDDQMKGSARLADVVPARIVSITEESWTFSPPEIVVKKGERVRLQVVGTKNAFSFAVAKMHLIFPVSPGQVVMVGLPTDEIGTFNYSCSASCLKEHPDMKGQIIIAE